MIDCEVLMNGYMKFREWMFEITNLDIDKYITLQSLCSRTLLGVLVLQPCCCLQ